MKVILVDAYHTLFTEKWLDLEIKKILDSFKNKKIVLTNANDEQIISFGIDKSPYEVFTLKHNPNKNNVKYFEFFLKKFNFKYKDLVYFEHNIDVVKIANSIGIKSYYFDKDKRDLLQLRKFLENNLN